MESLTLSLNSAAEIMETTIHLMDEVTFRNVETYRHFNVLYRRNSGPRILPRVRRRRSL